jgi:hypothetical protein
LLGRNILYRGCISLYFMSYWNSLYNRFKLLYNMFSRYIFTRRTRS